MKNKKGILSILLSVLVAMFFVGCADTTTNISTSKEIQAANQTENEDTRDTPDSVITEEIVDTKSDFYIAKIDDDLFERIKGKSFKDNCTVPREDLRYLHLIHTNLDGETLEGEMIVNVHIAETVLEIFKELYDAKYPIERIRLVDEYDADDETSMRDNNSSSFNFRFISNTTKVSKHGLGMAIDINTLYNPYVKKTDEGQIVEPATATEYVDRTKDFPYKISQDDLAYKLFIEHGFEWGGNWESLKDYQHFEMPTSFIEQYY